MRMLMWTTFGLLGLIMFLDGQPACAQGYARPQLNPYVRPTVSPYVNLARGGSPGINYYGVVRPQLQTTASLLQMQQTQALEASDINALATAGVPITGVSTQFMNFSHFYGRQITHSAVMRPAITPSTAAFVAPGR